MTGKLKDLTINRDGSQNLTLTITEDYREMFDKLKDENLSIEIKKETKKRSMDANAYFWHLCGEIAKASSKYSTDGKNDVYRDAIKAKGDWDALIVKDVAVDRFLERWGEKGTGWFAEVIDDYVPDDDSFDVMGDSKETKKIVHAYYGSSTYDTASMSRIIDWAVLVAQDCGISTITEKEMDRLIEAWGRKKHE